MAFQGDAFEEQAFQTGSEAKPPYTAFQSDAFQGNAFQIGVITGGAPPAADPLLRTLMGVGQGWVIVFLFMCGV